MRDCRVEEAPTTTTPTREIMRSTDILSAEGFRSVVVTIQPTGRAPALHTSFEEHRASLTERKNYRRWTKKKKRTLQKQSALHVYV